MIVIVLDNICTPRGRRILKPVALVAIVNFAIVATVALLMDGDALNGGIQEGVYYLGNHGRMTEVSPSIYWYSYVHGVSAVATHGMLGALGLYLFISGDLR